MAVWSATTAAERSLAMGAAVTRATSARAVREDAPAGLGLLDAIGVIRHLKPRESLAVEGDVADRLHRVTSGVVAAYKATEDGRRQIIAFHFPGDPVCLSTAGTVYDYSAEAIGHASVCSVLRTRAREYTKQVPSLSDGLLDAVHREMAAAHERLLWLGRKTARERLACFLLECASRVGEPQENGHKVVALPMNQQEIGDYLGLAAETVSRTLAEFKRDGIVEVLRPFSGVVIRDMQRLEATTDEGGSPPSAGT